MPILGKDHPCCLAIPELLRLVFAYMDDDDNARNAQVCKTWSEIALDCLWHSPVSVCRIFDALSPLSGQYDHGHPELYNFSHTPSVQDWEQFQKYSSRLRSFKFDSENAKATRAISRAVIHIVAQTRPISHIFPNSKQLLWRPQLSNNVHSKLDIVWKDTDARLFMHSGIESFLLRLSDCPATTSAISRARFLAEIPYRMSNLTHIEIITKLQPGILDNELCKLISELPKLKLVTLPACHLSARLFEALSKMPSLEKLRYEFADPSQIVGNVPSVIPLAPINIQRGFESLHYLEVLCRYEDICALVCHTPKLKTLKASSKDAWESVESLQTLLEVTSDQCPNLIHLDVTAFQTQHYRRSQRARMLGPDVGGIPSITFQTLRPLTKMPELVGFVIDDATLLAMSLFEVETLLSSLPQLKYLLFDHSPSRLNDAPFGLDILPVVGRHCKKLEEFSTFFDATRPIPSLREEDDGSLLPALTRLYVSVSIITPQVHGDVAIYLSDILPRKCEIMIISPAWIDHLNEHDEEDNLLASITNQRLTLWREVGNMIAPLRNLRLKERARAENTVERATGPLKGEIQELRNQIERLQNK